jgi:hypothetical protein
MAAKTIISRPIYGTLSPQPGKHHLFVADADRHFEALLAHDEEELKTTGQYVPRDRR